MAWNALFAFHKLKRQIGLSLVVQRVETIEISGYADNGVVDVNEHFSGFLGLERRRIAGGGRTLARRRLLAIVSQNDFAEAGIADANNGREPVRGQQPPNRHAQLHGPDHLAPAEAPRPGFDPLRLFRVRLIEPVTVFPGVSDDDGYPVRLVPLHSET